MRSRSNNDAAGEFKSKFRSSSLDIATSNYESIEVLSIGVITQCRARSCAKREHRRDHAFSTVSHSLHTPASCVLAAPGLRIPDDILALIPLSPFFSTVPLPPVLLFKFIPASLHPLIFLVPVESRFAPLNPPSFAIHSVSPSCILHRIGFLVQAVLKVVIRPSAFVAALVVPQED
jgi:hypothetical protein